MTNHVHILVTPGTKHGVSLVMRDVGRDYVRQINQAYRRTGTMWEGRFKSSLVDQEAYCLACYRYIELNPVRAGMVSDASEYPWSSYRANALGAHDALVSPHPCWTDLGCEDAERYRRYRDLLNQALNARRLEEIRYAVRKGLPTGSSQFKKQVESALRIRLGDGKRGRPSK